MSLASFLVLHHFLRYAQVGRLLAVCRRCCCCCLVTCCSSLRWLAGWPRFTLFPVSRTSASLWPCLECSPRRVVSPPILPRRSPALMMPMLLHRHRSAIFSNSRVVDFFTVRSSRSLAAALRRSVWKFLASFYLFYTKGMQHNIV